MKPASGIISLIVHIIFGLVLFAFLIVLLPVIIIVLLVMLVFARAKLRTFRNGNVFTASFGRRGTAGPGAGENADDESDVIDAEYTVVECDDGRSADEAAAPARKRIEE